MSRLIEQIAREAVRKFQSHPAGAWGDADDEKALLAVARLAVGATLSQGGKK